MLQKIGKITAIVFIVSATIVLINQENDKVYIEDAYGEIILVDQERLELSKDSLDMENVKFFYDPNGIIKEKKYIPRKQTLDYFLKSKGLID